MISPHTSLAEMLQTAAEDKMLDHYDVILKKGADLTAYSFLTFIAANTKYTPGPHNITASFKINAASTLMLDLNGPDDSMRNSFRAALAKNLDTVSHEQKSTPEESIIHFDPMNQKDMSAAIDTIAETLGVGISHH